MSKKASKLNRRTPISAYVMGGVLGAYLALVKLTSRTPKNVDWPTEPAIYTVWHGQLGGVPFVMPKALRKQTKCLISRHRWTVFLAVTAQLFGMGVIRGSSAKKSATGTIDKGGAQAFRQMLRHVKAGGSICLTPDGPRGPNRVAKEGVFELVAKTGLPHYHIVPTFSRQFTAEKRWDKLAIPKPFCRVHVALVKVETPENMPA